MRKNFFLKTTTLTALMLLTSLAGQGANSIVTSTFSPTQSELERAAYYKITIKGGELTERIELPTIPGLEFISEGNQRYFTSINGSMTRQTILIYQVLANEPGEYTMPAFNINLSDGKATVPSASISFIQGTPNSSGNKPIGLELKLPKETLYVGETVPCQLKLFVEAGVRATLVSNEPTQSSDAFILNHAEDSPQRAVTQKNGVQYQEIQWNYTLTPIKAGTFPLRFEYVLEASLPTEENTNAFNAYPLGSSLLSAMLNARRFKLETGKDTITIQSLPTEGRPDNFTGAIGEFQVFQKLSSHSAEIGEPITLTLSISGKGNFDRIQAPPIETKGQWKVYEPKRSFTPTDSLGYKGIETIEYVLIPQTQAITTTPRIEFSYFDPTDNVYRSAVADPSPITIMLPAQNDSQKTIAVVTPSLPQEPINHGTASKTPRESGLIGIKTEIGNGSNSLKPVFMTPLFWLLQGVLGGGIVAWYVLRMRSIRLNEDPAYAQRVFSKKAVKKHLLLAADAASHGNATAFFSEAQRTIQARLSNGMGKKADALTWNEIEFFLNNKGTAERYIQETRSFFEGTEALRFGGELSSWLKRLHTLIESLEK
jgi:hypothetical protein